MCVKMFVWDKKSLVCSGKSRQVQRILYICNAMADNIQELVIIMTMIMMIYFKERFRISKSHYLLWLILLHGDLNLCA